MSDDPFRKRLYAVQWAIAALDRLEGSKMTAPSSHVRAQSIVALLDEALWQLQALRAEVAPEIEPASEVPLAITNPAMPEHARVVLVPLSREEIEADLAGFQAAMSDPAGPDALRMRAWQGLHRLATDEKFREAFNGLSSEDAIRLMGLKAPEGRPETPAPRKRRTRVAPEPEAPAAAPVQLAGVVPADGAEKPAQAPAATPDPVPAAAAAEPVPEPARPSVVSPDAERVLQETGDEFRAKAAAAAEAAAQAKEESLAQAKSKALAARPEDVALPWKEGQYAGKTLSQCSVAELEHIIGQFVRTLANESDPERIPARKLWVERAKAWHAHKLDELVTTMPPEDRPQLVRHYESIASMATSVTPMHAERGLWLARVRELSQVPA